MPTVRRGREASSRKPRVDLHRFQGLFLCCKIQKSQVYISYWSLSTWTVDNILACRRLSSLSNGILVDWKGFHLRYVRRSLSLCVGTIPDGSPQYRHGNRIDVRSHRQHGSALRRRSFGKYMGSVPSQCSGMLIAPYIGSLEHWRILPINMNTRIKL